MSSGAEELPENMKKFLRGDCWCEQCGERIHDDDAVRAMAARIETLEAERAVLADLLARMREWCLSGDEPDAPDGTPTLLDVVNSTLPARSSRPVPATEETPEP